MNPQYGVVLAGGTGTRLQPYTFAINKHLLPVFDRPMVAYPIQTLKELGIREICVVTGKEHLEDFRAILGTGDRYGVRLTFRGQDAPQGVAHALLQSENHFHGQKVVTILGDDVFDRVRLPDDAFTDSYAYALVTKASDPSHVAIAEIDDSGRIVGIEEKPAHPKSDLMVVGLYVFPPDVFEVIRGIRPSGRGELEISSVADWYVRQGRLKPVLTDAFVADAGTEEGFKVATLYAAKKAGYRMG
jgi:glucose-1-phosphate thymidylyltransferase